MDVYGLTGGIGSGKSAVSSLLEGYGVPVVSADELSRIVVARGSEGLEDVVKLFGREVLDDNGDLDRRKMAAIVFQDPSKRRQLETILHPRIRERFEQVLDALEKAGHEVAVYEVPLLFEKNLQGEMKAVLLVTADEEARIARVRARDDVTETEVRARIAAQMDEDAKRKKADYIIENDGTMDDLRREVEFVLSRFLRVGRKRRRTTQRVPAIGKGLMADDPSAIPTEVPTRLGDTQAAPPIKAAPSAHRTEVPSTDAKPAGVPEHTPPSGTTPYVVPPPTAPSGPVTEVPTGAPKPTSTDIKPTTAPTQTGKDGMFGVPAPPPRPEGPPSPDEKSGE